MANLAPLEFISVHRPGIGRPKRGPNETPTKLLSDRRTLANVPVRHDLTQAMSKIEQGLQAWGVRPQDPAILGSMQAVLGLLG